MLDRSKKARSRHDGPTGDFANTLPGNAQPTDGFLGDWVRERDEDGSIYYVNQRTREATWTAPDGAYNLKKLPGTLSTYTLVLGEGVAPSTEEHEHHHPHSSPAAHTRSPSLLRTQRPSMAAKAVQAGASLTSYALASLQKLRHATDNRKHALAVAKKRVEEREARKLYAVLHQGQVVKDSEYNCICVSYLSRHGGLHLTI